VAVAGSGTDGGRFEDRSVRLILFGIVAVGVGLLNFALGLLQVAMVLFGALMPGESGLPTTDPSLLMGSTIYGLLGAAFVWLGVGSVRKRRWVRPLMLTLAWTWLAGGVLVALFTPSVMDSLALTATDPETAGFFEVAKLIVLVLVAGFGVLLPAAFIWVYRDHDLQQTCEAHDPGPAWTERCPTSVLGLSVGLGACAVLVLPMLARPALPFFTMVLTGWSAAVVLSIGALACAYLARSIYRMEMSGWWGTFGFFLLLGLATVVALVVLDPGELYRSLGYPEMQTEALEGTGILGGGLGVGISVLITAASLVYMVGIRKHFTRRNTV